MSTKSSKLTIPHPLESDCSLVGVLEQLAPEQSTHGRNIALILHGTMGHKDYLFQKRLAVKLPLDSFRFDFRGSHESGGTWTHGGLAEDLEDLIAVVEWLSREYGYVIELVVGHSRGSLVAMTWLCTSEQAKTVRGFVNASGRYRMEKILETPLGKIWKSEIASQGFSEWKITVARKPIIEKITQRDVDIFINWPVGIVWDKFPAAVDVLTVHGLADTGVPPYDALIYARALSNRHPGTHQLHFMENADHNFTGLQDQVVIVILSWWESHQNGKLLNSGIWGIGVQGKL